MRKSMLFACIAVLTMVAPAFAQDTLVSFKGTYTFQMVTLSNYFVEWNMNGQQVGFCNNAAVVGYTCVNYYTFDLLTGSLVADGAGHITSGTYSKTRDPNSYECNTQNNLLAPCPVVVPSGNVYSATKAYSVGALVDYTVGNVTKTYQAIRANTGKAPNWVAATAGTFICSYSNLNSCLWTQIPSSLTNGVAGNSGTVTGTYTVQANGLGVVTLTPTNCTGCKNVQFAFLLSPTNQIGQTFNMSGLSVLGNDNSATGSGVRVK